MCSRKDSSSSKIASNSKTKGLLLILMAIMMSSAGFAQDVTGRWNGILNVSGTKLTLIFNIIKTEQGFKTTLDSPDQGALAIPVGFTKFYEAKLTMKAAQLGITYEGVLNADSMIVGTFNQSGQSFPLNLARKIPKKEAQNRPQEPSKPLPYHSEEVKFKGQNGKIVLAGTLTLPKKDRDFPIVILISGSGPQNRDEEWMGHKPFLVLSDHLTKNGIGVLRYDDRGTAGSTGNFHGANSLDFAQDVESAINFIKSRKDLQHQQIGLIGHSEGGLIAPLVAANSKNVDFIVLMAGPGIRGDQILLEQQRLIGKVAGMSDEGLKSAHMEAQDIFKIILRYQNTDSLKSALENHFTNLLTNHSEAESSAGMENEALIKTRVTQFSRPWMQYFIKYEPANVLRKVRCPVLAINGTKDLQVSYKSNLIAISNALKEGGNKNVTIKAFPNLNHLFQECETGAMSEYQKIEETISPIVLDEITNWIIKVKI